MVYPKKEELNSSSCTERSIKKHYPEFYEMLVSKWPNLSHSERLYWFYSGIESIPLCKECGKPVKFINWKKGYSEFCCNKCVNLSKIVKERKIKTNIEKYGENYKEVLYKKSVECVREKYGVENVFESDEIKEKIRESNRKKLGVDYPMQSKDVRDKSKKTCLDKYGVEYFSQSDISIELKKNDIVSVEKMLNTKKNNYLINHDDIIDMDSTYFICKCNNPKCDKCIEKQFKIPKSVYWTRKDRGIELCTNILPIRPLSGTSIELFIRDILDEYNIKYTTNNRTLIGPKELDIYIPSHKIAIECNGTFWHSNQYKNYTHHFGKFKSCLEKGVQLLTIWEDWIIHKPEIVKSIILSKLGVYKNKIYARKCKIEDVSYKDCQIFLEENHIQGKTIGGTRLGLYYNEELVSIMVFGHTRKGIGNENCTELIRFCNKLNTIVIGGASKLFKYYVNNYKPTKIISFSSNDISLGQLYSTLGFEYNSTSKTSYWYIDPKTLQRYHRTNFTKSRLVKEGFDPSKSESQIMFERGYLKIYDSGQQKWVYEKN